MSIGGFFQNWGNWSPDKDRNDALNQAMNLFSARMLQGAGSGQNFSSILGGAIEGAQGGFNDATDRASKRKYLDSQIEENKSQAEYRKQQMEKMLMEARRAAAAAQMRHQVFNPDPTQAALSMGAAAGAPGPTTQAAELQQHFARNGYTPTARDLLPLAGYDDLKATDLSLIGKLNDPVNTPGGTWSTHPRTGQTHYLPRIPEGMAPGPGGQVAPVPGVEAGTRALAGAQAGGKLAGELPYVGPTAMAQAAGKAAGELPYVGPAAFAAASGKGAGEAPYDLVDIPLPNGQTMKVPRSMVLGMQYGQGRPGDPSNLSGGLPTGQINPGMVTGKTTDRVQRETNAGLFDKEWVTKRFPDIQKEGMVAQSTIAQMEALGRLGLQTGWGSGALAQLGAVLSTFGVAPDALKDFTTAAQVFNKFASDGVLLAQIAQAGPQTESDAKRMSMTLPQLGNTPEANALIIAYMKAGAEKRVAQANFYRDAYQRYSSQGVGRLEDIDAAWASAAPSIWTMPSMAAWAKLNPGAAGATAEIPR